MLGCEIWPRTLACKNVIGKRKKLRKVESLFYLRWHNLDGSSHETVC